MCDYWEFQITNSTYDDFTNAFSVFNKAHMTKQNDAVQIFLGAIATVAKSRASV